MPSKNRNFLNLSFPEATRVHTPHSQTAGRRCLQLSLLLRAGPTGRGMSVYPCLSTLTKVTLNASVCVHWCGVVVP